MNDVRLKRPCSECPFRSDRQPYFEPHEAEQVRSNLEDNGDFTCHKTLGNGPAHSSFCAGAAGTLVNDGKHRSNIVLMIIARTQKAGETWPVSIDRSNLYPSLDAWVDAHHKDD